jgi:hypothetical protein
MSSERASRLDSSDPEDIFRQDFDDADNEIGTIDEQEEPAKDMAYHRGTYTINACSKVSGGCFLPIAILIEKEHINPLTQIVDPNTGAMIAHYAAHHGNLKFLRYLEMYFKHSLGPNKGFPDFKDLYDCNLGHYCVRQGHLPVLIYLADKLHIDINSRDKFGYSPLEYSIVYKKLNCFIYLLYNRGFRTIKPELVESIAVGLFQESMTSAADMNSVLASDGKTTTSFQII